MKTAKTPEKERQRHLRSYAALKASSILETAVNEGYTVEHLMKFDGLTEDEAKFIESEILRIAKSLRKRYDGAG